jgi:hypothetical protein
VQRLSILRRAPLATLAGLAVASAAIRFVVALQVRSPLYYPDEYLYAAISRSFAHGTLGRVRGARVPLGTTVSYLVPLLTSPVWLIHDVATAYRLSQALASIAFACSALAAYALARRVGIDPTGSCVVAALTLLIPSGAFTATLLAEPYAYPLFLVAMVAAVEAIAAPSLLRVSAAGLLAAGLCAVAGLQFLLFAPACFAAYIVASPSLRAAFRRAALVVLLGAACVGALAVAGALSGLVARVHAFDYSVGDIAAWFGVNAFVLALSSGWVIIPGAALGLGGLATSGERRARAFAALSVVLVLGFLIEAAVWGSNGLGLYERFTFYSSPLLAIAFVWSMRMGERRRTLYATVAYATAAAAILLPLSSRLFISDDHSPTLLGLSYGLVLHLSSPPLLWAPLLGVLAVLTSLYGLRYPYAVAVAAAAVCVVTGIAGSRALIDHNPETIPHASVQGPASFLTYGGSNPDYLEESLFWNPEVKRVVVVGGDPAPDGFASVPAFATSAGLLTTASGRHIPGPFVIGPDATALARGSALSQGDGLATFTETPAAIVFGFYRKAGLLAPFGRFFAAPGAGKAGFRLILRLSSIQTPQTIGLKCASAPNRQFVVGQRAKAVAITVPRGGTRDCRFGLVSGGVSVVRSLHVIAKASFTIAP